MSEPLVVEEWRPVPLEGQGTRYEVSNLGRVRSLRKGGWYVLTNKKPSPNDTSEYLSVEVAGRNYTVHRLVAGAFLPSPEPGQTRVLHRDGDNYNCRADNLRWGTPRENAIEAMRHQTLRGSVLNEQTVTTIRGLHRRHNLSLEKLSEMFGVRRRSIRQIITRQTWSHIP